MWQRFRVAIPALFAVSFLLFVLWFLYWLLRGFLGYLNAVPKELAASLVAGVATVIVATMTVMLGRYFERKKELDALYRDKKMEIYDEFLKTYFALFLSNPNKAEASGPDDLVEFLRNFMRKLVLWSGPQPIITFLAWKDHLSKGTPDAQSIFLAEEFVLALRTDLRHSNHGLPRGFLAKIQLRESALFLAEAKKNPNITLADLADLEAKRNGS